MDATQIRQKFGTDYVVNEDTYVMGVHHILSDQLARRFAGYETVLDTNAGAGTTAIALAKYVPHVISVDLNSCHLAQAQQNADIERVTEKIEFIHGDIIELLEKDTLVPFDAALLDPDWAAPGNQKADHVTTLEDMQPSGKILFDLVNKSSGNICFRLPKEISQEVLDELPYHELQPILLNEKLKFYCAWFGGLRNDVR